MNRRIEVTLLVEYDEDKGISGFKSADPFDWGWNKIITEAVPAAYYAVCYSTKEMESSHAN